MRADILPLFLLIIALPAAAQPTGERRDALSAAPPDLYLPERFEPRGGGESFLSIAVPDRDKTAIAGGDNNPVMGFRLLGNISRNAYTPVTDDQQSVDSVAWRYLTEPMVDLRLPIGTVIAAGLPIVVQRGRVEPVAAKHQGDSLGDGWLEAIHAWQVREGYLGGAVRVTAPTGDEDMVIGNGALRVLGELIAGHPIGRRLLIAGSLGYRKAFPAKSDRSAGDEVVYRLGARLHAWQRRLHVETAIVGAVGVNGPVDDRVPESNLPVEWLLGTRWPVFSTAAMMHVGLGLGLDRGEGMPLARFLVAIDVACALGECMRPGGPLPDRDGDGVADYDDECPEQGEDIDEHDDGDGCPDIDNDRDGIPDSDDRCPAAPEDTDGFDDSDGCPDPDNDGDQIDDERDLCPDEAEDLDGYLDTDGCPDKDDDGDGIEDIADLCPRSDAPAMNRLRARWSESAERQVNAAKQNEVRERLRDAREDFDGFDDEDGCPDYDDDRDDVPVWDDTCPEKWGPPANRGCPYPDGDDRDNDGRPDLTDRCPDEPETINAFVDGDGCKDAFFTEDFRRYYTVHDDGRIALEQPIDAPAESVQGAIERRAAGDAYIDGEAEHRQRLGRALAMMLFQLPDPGIALEVHAPAGPGATIRAFVEQLPATLDHAGHARSLGARLIPMCAMPTPGGQPLAFRLCLRADIDERRRLGLPPLIDRRLRSGLPQNLPACPTEDVREENACPP